MKLIFTTKSFSGRIAIKIAVILVISILISIIFALAIGGDQNVIEGNILLSTIAGIISIIFTLSLPMSFFIGIYTGIKHKEWIVFKPLIVLYIITFLLFLLGEFLFPH